MCLKKDSSVQKLTCMQFVITCIHAYIFLMLHKILRLLLCQGNQFIKVRGNWYLQTCMNSACHILHYNYLSLTKLVSDGSIAS